MNTVFVIGAGANVEIGMPSGEDLKNEIAGRMELSSFKRGIPNGDYDMFALMQKVFPENEQLFNIASTINKALPFANSIDSFIDAHRNEPGIALSGKLAIVLSIMAAENRSLVYNYFLNSNENLLNTWYPKFFKKITEGCDIIQFMERIKNISFIIFNYDRCFEYFMINALCVYYKIGKVEATNIVKNMYITHPYGAIKDLDKLAINKSFSINPLFEISKNIRTYTEDSDETMKERIYIKRLINNADMIIFLGFAYHPMNMELLFDYDFQDNIAPTKDNVICYGTGFNISDKDREDIIKRLMERDPRIKNCDISADNCYNFFNNFWYRLFF